jgi:predicted hydrolase (HD superfamily)
MVLGWLVVNVQRARNLARSHLAADLPQRWRHVRGVAHHASQIAPSVAGSDDTLVCAAWLHDIGYAPEVAASGFHPLDGARFLAAAGVSKRLLGLVAHHSRAGGIPPWRVILPDNISYRVTLARPGSFDLPDPAPLYWVGRADVLLDGAEE